MMFKLYNYLGLLIISFSFIAKANTDPFYPKSSETELQNQCLPNKAIINIYPELEVKGLTLVGIIRQTEKSFVLLKDKEQQIFSLGLKQMIGISNWELVNINEHSIEIINWGSSQDCARPKRVIISM